MHDSMVGTKIEAGSWPGLINYTEAKYVHTLFQPKKGSICFLVSLMIVQYLPSSVNALAIFLASCLLGLLFSVLSSIVYCLNFIWSYLNPLNSISGFGYADSLQWQCCTNTLSNSQTIFLDLKVWKHPCHQTLDKLILSISSDLLRSAHSRKRLQER